MKDLRPRKYPRFVGSVRRDISALPEWARKAVGFNIDLLQLGDDPMDFEPRADLGSGVLQVYIGRNLRPTYRVMVVAKFPEAVYVLHVFEKRSRKTSEHDNKLTKERYREVVEFRKNKGYT